MHLVDTHVLLWWFSGSDRIGETVKHDLQSAGHAHYSAASLVEITIKAMLGKVVVPEDFHQHVVESGWIEIPVRSSHAAAMVQFSELARHDPFDRILLAQADVERLTFVTADRRLLRLAHPWIVDAAT